MKKSKLNRILAFVVSLALLLPLVPVIPVAAAGEINFQGLGVLPYETRFHGAGIMATPTIPPVLYSPSVPVDDGTIVYSFRFDPSLTASTDASTAQMNRRMEMMILPVGHSILGGFTLNNDTLRNRVPIILAFASWQLGTNVPPPGSDGNRIFTFGSTATGNQGGTTIGTPIVGFEWNEDNIYDIVVTINFDPHNPSTVVHANPTAGAHYIVDIFHEGSLVGSSGPIGLRPNLGGGLTSDLDFTGGIGAVYLQSVGPPTTFTANFTLPAHNAFGTAPECCDPICLNDPECECDGSCPDPNCQCGAVSCHDCGDCGCVDCFPATNGDCNECGCADCFPATNGNCDQCGCMDCFPVDGMCGTCSSCLASLPCCTEPMVNCCGGHCQSPNGCPCMTIPAGTRNFRGLGLMPFESRNILPAHGAFQNNVTTPGEPILYEVPPRPGPDGLLPFAFQFTPTIRGGGNTGQVNQQTELYILPASHAWLNDAMSPIGNLRGSGPIAIRFISHAEVGTGGANNTIRASHGTQNGGQFSTPLVIPGTAAPYEFTIGNTYDIHVIINTNITPNVTYTMRVYHGRNLVAITPHPITRTAELLPENRDFVGSGIGGVFLRRDIGNAFAADFAFPAENAFGGRPPDAAITINDITPQEDGFDIAWSSNLWTGEEHEVTITGYYIEWNEPGGTTGRYPTTGVISASSAQLRSHLFTYDTEFTFVVRADGQRLIFGDLTNVSIASGEETDSIIDNRDLEASVDGFTAIWSRVYGATHYVIYYTSNPAIPTQNSQIVNAPLTTVIISGLAPATYHVSVAAYDGTTLLRTDSLQSVIVQGELVSLETLTAGEDRFTLVWTSLGDYTSYEIEYSFVPAGGGAVVTRTVSNAVSPQVVGSVDFDYDVMVTFVVRGIRAAGEPVESNSMQAQIIDRRPASPRAFTNGFGYAWSAVWGATHYVVRFGTTPTNLNESRQVNAPDTRFEIRDDSIFTIGETWYFEVAAYNGTTALRTLSGLSVTIREPQPVVPQTLSLREGVAGYSGTRNIGFMPNNNAGNAVHGIGNSYTITMSNFGGVALIYFDLEDIFEPLGIDYQYVFVTAAELSFAVTSIHNNPRALSLHRVVDPDNLGMWVEGTNTSTPEWNVASRNNGASWLHRNNNFTAPGGAGVSAGTPTPWVSAPAPGMTPAGSNMSSSVVRAASGSAVPQGLAANNRFEFTGSGMAQDINNWLADPALNQGWMIAPGGWWYPVGSPGRDNGAGPNFHSRRSAEHLRPTLTLTFLDLSDADDAMLFMGDITPDEDGFHLEWFAFSNPPMDRFVINYTADGLTGSIEITDPEVTSMFVGNHLFVYDLDVEFTVSGFMGAEEVVSDPQTSTIIDRRAFAPTPDGFSLAWSRVYGAQSYVITSWNCPVLNPTSTLDITITITDTSVTVTDPAFGFGTYYYRLVAFSGPNGTGSILRDSGDVSFGTADNIPPTTYWTVNANWATTAMEVMRLPVNINPITITIDSAIDPAPGSGVRRTEFRFDDDFMFTNQFNQLGRPETGEARRWNLNRDPWNEVAVGGQITVDRQGVTRVWIRSVDYAGNVESPIPIYVAIDKSPLIVSQPIVTLNGDSTPLATLPSGAAIDISVDISNRAAAFNAMVEVALFDGSGRMVQIVPGSAATVGVATLTATMNLPAVNSDWYIGVFLIDTAANMPIYQMVRFPYEFNVQQYILPYRPLHNTIVTNAMAPIIVQEPDSLIVLESARNEVGTFALTVEAVEPPEGNNVLSFQWFLNGSPISGAIGTAHNADLTTLSVGTHNFHVVVTNTRTDATGNQTATARSQTATIEVTQADILASTLPNRIFVTNGNAANINTNLVEHTAGNHWFRDHNGTWRDNAGRLVADPDSEIIITNWIIPAVPPVNGISFGVEPAPMTNYNALFTILPAHGLVNVMPVDAASQNHAIRYFAIELVGNTPGDLTPLTPISQPAALAYALPGDEIRLFMYGENNVLLAIYEGTLSVPEPIEGEVTIAQINPDATDSITIVTLYEDGEYQIIAANRLVRVRFSDGTRDDNSQLVMFYADLTRINDTTWQITGLPEMPHYHVLSGYVQGYDTYTDVLDRVAETFTVTIIITPIGSGTVTGLSEYGEYEDGDTAELTAVPEEGYLFSGWYLDNARLNSDPVHSFVVTEDIELEARFSPDDGIRTIVIQNGRPWMEGGPIYSGNFTRNGIHDALRGCDPTAVTNQGSDFFLWNLTPEFTGNFTRQVQQGLLFFDLSEVIPEGAEILHATLHLGHVPNGNQGGTSDMHIYRLLDPSGTGPADMTGAVSWQNKNGATRWQIPVAGVHEGSINTVTSLSAVIEDINLEGPIANANWLTANVTADIQAWVAAAATDEENPVDGNLGWLIRQENAVRGNPATNNPGAIVIANGASGALLAGESLRPMLTIELQLPVDGPDPINLVSIANPTPISITRAQAAAGEWGLPTTVSIEVIPADAYATADVSWGEPSPAFDPSNPAAQTLTFTGTVILPDGVTNTNAMPLTATATVNVPAETLLTLTVPTDVTLSQAVANYEAVIALLPGTVNVTTTGETTSLPINWSFTGTFDTAAGAQNTFAWAAQLGGILANGVAAYGTIVVTNYTPTQLPVFSWNIFNNGPGGTQYPRHNAGLAASGTIRMWTQLDGVGAPVYLAAADTIVALDQNGENAIEFVNVSRVWVAGQGWANYFNVVDVNKNGNWQYINLYITVYGRVVHVLLVNALFEAPAEDVTVTFVVEAGAVGVYAATATTVVVPAGEAIPAAAIPNTDARTGFYFAGWYPSDPAELAYVTEDITFTARFNPLFHNVTFVAGDGGVLVPTDFGLVVSIRDGFAFWANRVPAPVANYGYEFVGWNPYNPAGFIVRENMTFTAVFAEAIPLEPQIVSVSPAIARVEQGGTVELTVTTQRMPDGAWVELHVAWHPGLSVVGGPRFYIVNNQATITIAAAANAQLGRNGFAVSARTAGDWGSVVMIDSYMFVIAVE